MSKLEMRGEIQTPSSRQWRNWLILQLVVTMPAGCGAVKESSYPNASRRPAHFWAGTHRAVTKVRRRGAELRLAVGAWRPLGEGVKDQRRQKRRTMRPAYGKTRKPTGTISLSVSALRDRDLNLG